MRHGVHRWWSAGLQPSLSHMDSWTVPKMATPAYPAPDRRDNPVNAFWKFPKISGNFRKLRGKLAGGQQPHRQKSGRQPACPAESNFTAVYGFAKNRQKRQKFWRGKSACGNLQKRHYLPPIIERRQYIFSPVGNSGEFWIHRPKSGKKNSERARISWQPYFSSSLP